MSRFASTINATAVTLPHVPYVAFLELDFLSGTLYLSSGDKVYTWGSNAYQPLGQFAAIADLTESTDITSQSLQFTLSGVDSGLMNTTLAEAYHGRTALLSVGYLDPNTGALLDTPESIWSGLMDVMTIKADKNTAAIILTCENRLVAWNQASGWLYTQEHQRLIDATDNFLDQVTSLSNKSVVWGNSGVSTGGSVTPGKGPYLPPGLGGPVNPGTPRLPWQF